jgi:RNA polymerase sigma-70 factor (ECF subfamily)
LPSILNPGADSGDYSYENSPESTEIPDRKLVALISRGDEAALAELYQRHSVPLYNYLLRLVRDQSIAEDLLQEVFIAIWTGSSGFRGRSKVKTWIFRIAHNRAVSWLRKHARPEEAGEQEESPAPADNPETVALRHWRQDQVRQAVDQLSPKHRAVIELAFVHDLSYSEIAEVVDCPTGTVKSRISYAMRRLDGILRTGDLSE